MMVNAKKLGKGAAAEQDMFSNPLSSDTFEVEGGAGRAVDAPAEPAPDGVRQKWRHAINSISQMSQVNVGPHASRRSLFCLFLSS